MLENKLDQPENNKNSSTNISQNNNFPIVFLNNHMRSFKNNHKQKISDSTLFKQEESSSATEKRKSYLQQLNKKNQSFRENNTIKQIINQKKQNESKKYLVQSQELPMQEFKKYIGRASKISKWQVVNLQKSILKQKKKFSISAKKIKSIIPTSNPLSNQSIEVQRKPINRNTIEDPTGITKLKQIYISKNIKKKKKISKVSGKIKDNNKKFETYQSDMTSQQYYDSNSINQQQQNKIQNQQQIVILHQLTKITQYSHQQDALKRNSKNTNASSTLKKNNKKIENSQMNLNNSILIIQKAKQNLSQYVKSINPYKVKLNPLKFSDNEKQSKKNIFTIKNQNYITKIRPSTTRYVDPQEQQLVDENQLTPMQQLNAIPNITQSIKTQSQNKIQIYQNKKEEDQASTNVPSNKKSQLIQVPSFREIMPNDNEIDKLKNLHRKQNNFGKQNLREIIEKFKSNTPFYKKIDLDKAFIKRYKNGVYLGQLRKNTQQTINPIKQGYGAIFYYSGKLYQGQLFDNQKHGRGLEVYPDNSFYQGQFQNGHKEGNGRFVWNNGEIYDGQWHLGKRHGSGMWKNSDDAVESYIGQWFQGKIEGFGVFTSSKGTRYQGQFRNSLKHGEGTERYINGDIYIGSYQKDLQNGYGQYYFKNGDIYKGDFKNGLKHGKGVYSEATTGNIYEGEFQNDKKCGFGQYIWKNGDTYNGTFQNQLKHGYGEYITCDSKAYQGFWLNDNILNENKLKKKKKKVIQKKSELITDRTMNLRSPIKTKRLSPHFNSSLNQTVKRDCGCTKVNHY